AEECRQLAQACRGLPSISPSAVTGRQKLLRAALPLPPPEAAASVSRITRVSGSKDPLPIPSMFPFPDRGDRLRKPRDRAELLGQSSNQAQQFLLLWSIASLWETGGVWLALAAIHSLEVN